MKKIKSIFRILAAIAILFGFNNSLFAKSDEVKDSFEKTYKVSESDKLVLNMYDSDLQISTWSNNEIKLTGEIIVSGGEKNDIDKLLEAFKNPEVSQGSGRIDINTSFIESSSSFSLFGISSSKIKLSNGETISVKSIKSNYTICVPEKIAFKLMSKYNTIKASNLLGSIDFQLYNVNLDMGDFGDKSHFDAKYSTVNAGKGKDAKFELYDSKFFIDALNKVIIDSKYTKFSSNSINLLALESYNDTYTIENLNGIDIDAKYTTLKAKGNSNLGKFRLYDSNIDVENFTKIEYDSKYSEFNANKVGTFDIKTSYNDTYEVKEVNDFSCDDSKYNKIHLGIVQTSISLPDTYDSEISAEKISSSFTSFKGDFKYGTINLTADPALSYKLNCETTYGEINYPKIKFKNKPLVHIETDSKTQLEASTDPNATCEFNFTSYDTKFTIE